MRSALRMLALPPVSGLLALLLVLGALFILRAVFGVPTGGWFWGIAGWLVLLWVLGSAFWAWRRRRRSASKAEQLVAEPDPTGEQIDAEGRVLQDKFATAIRQLAKLRLKGSGGRSRYLYELPWYVFIGPPGAGKTTALQECGLDFPLHRSGEPIDIEGGGGTRNCNWVFTNDAVFIDTAGRYTTQGSNETVDAAAWRRFLDLLRRQRPREPINGVIVAIGLGSSGNEPGLAQMNEAEIDASAAAVRARLRELGERMEAKIPVYVMFTKADLIVGFNEFFESMRPEERRQVWGVTFPLGDGEAPDAALRGNLDMIGEDFEALVDRLGEIQFRHLRDQPDLSVRAKIFSFPAQFSSMKPVIERFLRKTFDPDNWTDPMRLRGFYFTSATQMGQPIDRLVASLARNFGIERQALPALAATSARSYFLEDLLKKVVFPEAGLVASSVRGRPPFGRYAALAACVALPLLAGAGLWSVHRGNVDAADTLEEALDDYKKALRGHDLLAIDSGEMRTVLPALDTLREVTLDLDAQVAEGALLFGLPLPYIDRRPQIVDQAKGAYDMALERLLRPRVIYRTARELSRDLARPERIYGTLKDYLITVGYTGSKLEGNRAGLQRRIARALRADPDFEGRSGRQALESLVGRDGRGGHVAAWLLPGTLEPWGGGEKADLDDELVNRARAEVAIRPEQRALDRLVDLAEEEGLPGWSLRDRPVGGLDAAFVAADGGEVRAEIPALFTRRGYHEVFDQYARAAVEHIENENWVLVDGSGGIDRDRVTDDLERLYSDRYIEYWRGVLEGLRIRPFVAATDANTVLDSLGQQNNSPLQRILDEIVRETALDVPLESGTGEAAAAAREAGERNLIRRVGEELASKGDIGRTLDAGFTAAQSSENSSVQGEQVVNAFEDLRKFIEGEGIRRLTDQFRAFRTAVNDRARGRETTPLSDSAAVLDLEAALGRGALPDTVEDIVTDMLAQADETTARSTRAKLDDLWTSKVLPVCRRIENTYPFSGREPASFGDIAAAIGPDGAVTEFFRTHLASRVNLQSWQWRPEGLALGIPTDRLDFFRDVDRIGRALFAGGAAMPGFEVTVRARADGEGVEETMVSIGGNPALFTSGDRGPYALNWPGAQSARGAEVAVTVEEPDPGFDTDTAASPLPLEPQPRRTSERLSGRWGLFELVDRRSTGSRDGGRSQRLRLLIDGRLVVVDLNFGTLDNPFNLRPIMRDLRCPGSL